MILLLAPALAMLRDLREALRFLTRLPVPGPPSERGAGEAMGAFPLAGLALGLILLALDWALARLGLAPIARAALLVVALAWLSGGLHLDGLMDSCDGLFGGQTPERRLEIMRDSRVGSWGVLAGICVLGLKFALLADLGGAARVGALLLAPMLGRWSLVLAALLFPPARSGGLGAAFRAAATPRRALAAAGTCLAVALPFGSLGLVALLASCVATWRLGRAIVARIPGLTGDTYGAICESNEVLVLVVCAIGVRGASWLG